MHFVQLIANRALTGNYGHREAGESFTTDNRTAESLEARGLARRYFPPAPIKVYAPPMQAKMMAPPENKMLTVGENKGGPTNLPEMIETTTMFTSPGHRTFTPAPTAHRGPGRPPGAKNKPR